MESPNRFVWHNLLKQKISTTTTKKIMQVGKPLREHKARKIWFIQNKCSFETRERKARGEVHCFNIYGLLNIFCIIAQTLWKPETVDKYLLYITAVFRGLTKMLQVLSLHWPDPWHQYSGSGSASFCRIRICGIPRRHGSGSDLFLWLFAVLWSRNFLFQLRLRLSKSFGSGSSSGAGSDISFITTFYHRFHIKKWIIHVFLWKNVNLTHMLDPIQYEFLFLFTT